MRRSFVRLIIRSVLLSWAGALLLAFLYTASRTWTEDRALQDGVFLVHEILEQEPAPLRAARLRELQPHFSVDFSLVELDEVGHRVGRPVRPGERIHYAESYRAEWFFVPFADEHRALAAGPFDPAVPKGVLPVGLLLTLFGLPVIAGFIALSVERELTKVERASQALAEGEFSARVDNPSGPSTELAASFNAMAERIERLIRSRDEIVQAVSHELGSPLSRLRFHMELLQNLSDEEREGRLSAMTRDLDALDDLVAELLSYAQADEIKLKPCAFDPKQGLNDLAELAVLEAPEERGVEVDLAIPDGSLVYADQRTFQRAVENILRNAVQHTRRRVRLELNQSAEHLRVTVHDDGPGIPEALRDKVVTPFFRLEADRTRTTGGVGLGLAIVARIMEKHGGRLEIGTSDLGGAAVATVWPRPD